MKKISWLTLFNLIFSVTFAQKNIISTNTLAEQVMLGHYDPLAYNSSLISDLPDVITAGINANVNSDTLHQDLVMLGTFYNRNTGSDTVSATKGIGAARRWVYQKFQQYSAASGLRLIPSYLQFDTTICS